MFTTEKTEISRIAREAGKIILSLYAGEIAVEFKGKSNPVTEADRRANAYIVEQLQRCFPDDGIIAEETADHSGARKVGRCWYVDPLDGTKEFIAKNGEFSVMIGLAVDGASQFGIVYQPVRDKLYWGIADQEAGVEESGATRALHVRSTEVPSELCLVASRSHRSSYEARLVDELGIVKEMASGSVGLKVGLISEQAADLYVNVSDRTGAWDACGPEAILRGAGGCFTDLRGQPLVYEGTDVRNRHGLLACNGNAFESVRAITTQIAIDAGLVH